MNTRWMAEHYGSGGSMDNPTDLFEIVTECGSKRIAEAVDAKDAMLIAAAPEMLRALQYIILETGNDVAGLPRDDALDLIGEIADVARAAIRKAGVEA